ncbi:M4 family metallopeptidase [Kitasatospora sp. NPDC048365]|uniref:M4 family metallopeptidase n=1 Tax=Kitasatospora sp. NPDC048365 TaxID=3364050 RepID=UPI00371A71F2
MTRKTALAAAVAAALTLGTATVAVTQSTALASSARPTPGFQALSADARAQALGAADREASATARALGLGGDEKLVAKDVLVDADGSRHVRYDRTYRGLPVIGGDLVVHRAADGRITGTDLAHQGAVTLSTVTPRLTAADASAHAVRSAKHVKNAKADTAGGQLVVYAVGKIPVLAYRSTVSGAGENGAASREAVVLDAAGGAVLDQYELHQDVSGSGNGVHDGQVSLETTQSGSNYQLVDGLHGNTAIYDSNNSPQSNPGQNARLFSKSSSNSWGNGSTNNRESAAVDAAFGLAKTWDYYKSTFNRSGIRNDGRGAPAYVHVDNNLLNAFYDDNCFCMSFGDGSSQNNYTPVTSLDVAGHEMTHGVTAATAGLNYSGESGGLNEATSDILGTMVEFYSANANDPGDYYIGEKLNMSTGYFRRMDNPAVDGKSLGCWNSNAGSVDVHYSSGIGNHFFYLLSEGTGTKTIGGRSHNGTTCNNDTFAGIGKDKAAAIWYRALSAYMTSTTNYSGARTAVLKAAADLYGTNSQERYLASKAWAAVSVGTALPDPGNGTPTPTPSPTSSPTPGGNALANGGFEQGTTGWTQSAQDITNSTQQAAHGGSWYAWMMGYGSAATESLSQSNIAVPATGTPKLTFWLKVTTQETGTTVYDTLKVNVNGTTLATYSNANAGTAYVQKTVDLSAYKGQTVKLEFAGQEDAYASTIFLVDDVAIG